MWMNGNKLHKVVL